MKVIILIIYLFFFSLSLGLKWLNIKYLKEKGHQVPAEFSTAIDTETLRKTVSYTAETNRLNTVLSLLNTLLVLVFLFGGFITIYDNWVTSLSKSFVLRCAFCTGSHVRWDYLQYPFQSLQEFQYREPLRLQYHDSSALAKRFGEVHYHLHPALDASGCSCPFSCSLQPRVVVAVGVGCFSAL